MRMAVAPITGDQSPAAFDAALTRLNEVFGQVSGSHFTLKLSNVSTSVAVNIFPITLKTNTSGNLENGKDSVAPFLDKQ